MTPFAAWQTLDRTQTAWQLSKMNIADPAKIRAKLSGIHQQAPRGTGGDEVRARGMVDDFIERTVAMRPPPGSTVRDLLVADRRSSAE